MCIYIYMYVYIYVHITCPYFVGDIVKSFCNVHPSFHLDDTLHFTRYISYRGGSNYGSSEPLDEMHVQVASDPQLRPCTRPTPPSPTPYA